jgi:integrase
MANMYSLPSEAHPGPSATTRSTRLSVAWDTPKNEMTAHGFRAMASTILHEQGWPSDVIERQMAHTEQNKVKGAYDHAQHLL